MPLAVLGTCCAPRCSDLPVVDLRDERDNGWWLCVDHLDTWLDMADDGEIDEPSRLTWLADNKAAR